MSLINYGFAAAFNLQSGFAILDEDNRLVSTVDSGSPETWYNRNPEQYADSRNLTHTLKAAGPACLINPAGTSWRST